RSDKLLISGLHRFGKLHSLRTTTWPRLTRNRPDDLPQFYWCQRQSAYLAITYGQTLVISRDPDGDYDPVANAPTRALADPTHAILPGLNTGYRARLVVVLLLSGLLQGSQPPAL